MKKITLFSLAILVLLACKEEQKASMNDVNENISKTIEKEKDTVIEDAIEVPRKKTIQQIKKELNAKGFQTFDYVDEKTKDTVLMQQYFMAFLKTGPIRNQNEEEAEILQKEHRAHLGKMYELGFADISGPFGDDGDIKGITIYNVPTLKMADSLANSDPMVKSGRLVIEIHPWWAAKGVELR